LTGNVDHDVLEDNASNDPLYGQSGEEIFDGATDNDIRK
jgi:hypothetical protein